MQVKRLTERFSTLRAGGTDVFLSTLNLVSANLAVQTLGDTPVLFVSRVEMEYVRHVQKVLSQQRLNVLGPKGLIKSALLSIGN